MLHGNDEAYQEFLAARNVLLRHADDPTTARVEFRWPRPRSFNWATDWFDHVAADNDRVALRIVAPGGDRELSFRQMARRSARAADWLSEHGVRRGDVVMLLLDNRAELWELMLALIRIRAVIAPTFITVSEPEFEERIRRTGAKHVIADSRVVKNLAVPEVAGARIAVGGPASHWVDFAEVEDHDGEFVPEGPTDTDEPLFYYFTSGSTSRPKLVVHTHVSYPVGHLASMYWNGLRPGDVHLNVSAPGWAKYPWSSLFGPWNAEATVVSIDTADATPERLLDVLRTGGITSFCAPPGVWRGLVRAGLDTSVTGVRQAASVGEPLMRTLADQVREVSGLSLRNGYGQSEVTALTGVFAVAGADPVSMGNPLPGYDLVVCSPGTDEESTVGELCVDLDNDPIGMMRGYADQQDNVRSRTPLGRYRTGDLVRWEPDGTLTYLGRHKDAFDSAGGEQIMPLELEHVLTRHPAVAEAVVVPVTEDDELVPKGYVVLTVGWNATRATADALFAHLRSGLPEQKVVALLEFVDDLPRTESDKVRRESVRHLRRSPMVEFAAKAFSTNG